MNAPVSFPIAKLLKEKGYNEPCALLYDESGKISGTKMSMAGHPNTYINKYSAPTISEVVMWIYDKHGIWVYVDSHEFSKWCYYYRYNRPHELSSKITENGQFGLDDFNSPTEAYEAAIEYCLENLI